MNVVHGDINLPWNRCIANLAHENNAHHSLGGCVQRTGYGESRILIRCHWFAGVLDECLAWGGLYEPPAGSADVVDDDRQQSPVMEWNLPPIHSY